MVCGWRSLRALRRPLEQTDRSHVSGLALPTPPDLSWVDVGCGTGALTEIVLEKAVPNCVVGVEPSEGFLGVAKASIEDARAEFMIGDAQSLPLEKHEVDVVVSGLVVNFVPDKRRALEEMLRIVKPGGTVAAYV